MRVRWTEPAARDLTQICDYIEEHDTSSTARRVAISIYERLSALMEFPEQGATRTQIRHSRAYIHRPAVSCHLPHPGGRSGNPPYSTWRAELAVMNWSEI